MPAPISGLTESCSAFLRSLTHSGTSLRALCTTSHSTSNTALTSKRQLPPNRTEAAVAPVPSPSCQRRCPRSLQVFTHFMTLTQESNGISTCIPKPVP